MRVMVFLRPGAVCPGGQRTRCPAWMAHGAEGTGDFYSLHLHLAAFTAHHYRRFTKLSSSQGQTMVSVAL